MKPLRFDGVLFDLDGTLADTAADIALALEEACRELDVPLQRPVLSLVDGSPLEEIFAVLAPGAEPAEFERFAMSYRARYTANGHRLTRIFPGVIDTLEALTMLRPRPRLGVATARRAEAARGLCVDMGLARYFDVIEGSGGTTMAPKPSPDLPLTISYLWKMRPERMILVGDTVRDVLAGRAAGMQTAAVLYGLGDRESIVAAKPDHLLEDLEDLLALLTVA